MRHGPPVLARVGGALALPPRVHERRRGSDVRHLAGSRTPAAISRTTRGGVQRSARRGRTTGDVGVFRGSPSARPPRPGQGPIRRTSLAHHRVRVVDCRHRSCDVRRRRLAELVASGDGRTVCRTSPLGGGGLHCSTDRTWSLGASGSEFRRRCGGWVSRGASAHWSWVFSECSW